MVEVGSWKNFEDIEENLILDELLLLTEQLQKKRRHEMRVAALAQGVDIDEDQPEEGGDSEDLPPEVLEAERRFKEERERKRLAKAAEQGMQHFADGLGYEVVN
jgi:hypothetical protein